MKLRTIATAGFLATIAWTSHAQSSVTIYGVVDLGLTYISNNGGGSRKAMDSGAGRPSRLGFTGREDLGGGLAAIFTLESAFNFDTGAPRNAAAFFDRESSVGLSSTTWGTVKFGRMADFFSWELGVPDSAPFIQGGLAAGFQGFARPSGTPGAPPPVDVHYGPYQYNNSVKWVGKFGDVGAGLMYGLGSENRQDKMMSAFVNYRSGPLSLGAGYTKDNFTTAVFAREVWGVRGMYVAGPVQLLANYAVGKDTTSQAKIRPLEIAVNYNITPTVTLGGGYGYARATDSVGRTARITQPFVGTKYFLSKRTNLYAMAAFNKTSDKSIVPATVGVPGGATAASTSDTMNAIRVGITHSF